MLDTVPASLEDTVKTNLITLIDNLQSVQFEVIKANIQVNSESNSTNYTIVNLLQDGSNQTQVTTFDDALFQFITSASSVRNSTLTTFNNTSTVDSTKKNFYYVNYNGLRPLRWGSENIAMDFYNYYFDRTSTYWITIEIIMIVALVVVAVSMVIIVPFVFSVQKTNNRVLSLFGYIPRNDINLLADKCERYLDTYLEDRDERRDGDYDASQDEEGEGEEEGYADGEEQGEGDGENPDVTNSVERSQASFNAGEAGGEVLHSSAMNVSQATEGNGIENKVALYKDSTPKKNGFDQEHTARPMNNSVKGHLAQSLRVPDGRMNNSKINTSKMDNSRMGMGRVASTNQLNKSLEKSRSKDGKFGSKSDMNGSLQKSHNASTLNERPRAEALLDRKAAEERAEQEADAYLERSQKLLNSKDNNRFKTIFQFSIFALLFMAYFAIDFGTEVIFVNNVRNAYIHFRQILERPADVKFVNVFAQEELATSGIVTIEGKSVHY